MQSTKRVRFSFIILAFLLCLFLTGALSNRFIGHTQAWFTSAVSVDATITADSTSSEWMIEHTLNGDLGQISTGGTVQKPIGTITAKIDNLIVYYDLVAPPDYSPEQGIYNIWDLRDTDLITPTSPFTLTTAGTEVFLAVNIKVLGNHDLGIYKGQMELTFSDPTIEPFVIPLEVEVVKKIK